MNGFRTALLLGGLAFLSRAAAQVITLKQVGDKTVGCMHSGLMSTLDDCGFRSDWYTDVFVGKISAVTAVGHDEEQVQIIPQEIFIGNPDNPMTVVTSQALCLPKLVVGERWLFYLRKVGSKPVVLDYYGNDSLPLSEATEKMATLRRLKGMNNSGILRGRVSTDGRPIANVPVFAGRSDGTQFAATTNADGRYEFESLLPEEYKVSTKPIGAYQSGTGEIEIKPESCWDLTLSKAPSASR